MEEGPTHRKCSKCGERKPLDDFRLRKSYPGRRSYRGTMCKSCHYIKSLAWRAAHIDVIRSSTKKSREKHKEKLNRSALEFHFKKKYGLTMAERDQMLADQGGRCAICSTTAPRGKGWCVDHNHETGKIRSILCQPCNLVIGHAAESKNTLLAAITYLEKHNGASS